MIMQDIMNENDIPLECLFTLARLDNKEGLMFFEPVSETVDDIEVTNLDPKYFIIDGAKYIYHEEMNNKIVINAVNCVITFTRIDGVQLNIDTNQIEGFPFATSQFIAKVFAETAPDGYIEIKD